MAVPYYFGQQAIAERLGYKSPHTVQRLIEYDILPAYQRIQKNRNGRGNHKAWCISESAITAWELTKGAESIRRYKAMREQRRLKRSGAVA